MAEIVPVVSEALEAQIRNLLPSQRGFGEDLQASNVITPIIDLTAVAEGSDVPEYQAQALAFGSQTAFSATNSTVVLANTAGFYRIIGTSNLQTGAGNITNLIQMSDGLSTKNIWGHNVISNGTSDIQYDFIVFLRTGDSVSAISPSTNAKLVGSTRQVADVNGTVVYPTGFTPQ